MSVPDWARTWGPVLFAAVIRDKPADFDVTEVIDFEFSGTGEHDVLFIEKTAANTEWVSVRLARHAGVPAKDIGYSGLKDRHAIARQWFSVPRWNSPDWDSVDIQGVSIIDVQRHARKLRRGTHRANQFKIVLRGQPPEAESLQERLGRIRQHGVPNYFGPQRFGRSGANIQLADRWGNGARLARRKRRIAISTARSYLFNEILASRVIDGSWNRIVNGDVANLDGTGSIFEVAAVDDELARRCLAMDLHPTAPLWGEGADTHSIPDGYDHWLQALSNARVKPTARSLRMRVMNLQWAAGDDTLELQFKLGRGSFATSVLRELADIHDHGGNQERIC